MSILRWEKRCPYVTSPLGTPSSGTERDSSSSFAQSHRIGRGKRRPPVSHTIDFENASPRTIAARRSGSGFAATNAPRKPSRSTSSSGPTPWRRAKPSRAWPGALTGGPFTHSGCERSGRSSITNAIRLGVTKTRLGGGPTSRWTSVGSCSSASRQAPAGSSSQPISNRSAGMGLVEGELRDRAREVADAPDVIGPRGDGKRSARVQEVERVRCLQDLVVGRERQAALEKVAALRLVLGEAAFERLHRGGLEVVGRPLALVLAKDVAPGHPGRPLELEGGPLPLQDECEPLEAVRDLGREQVELEPAHLLEVRPLRDFHAVNPDLPAEAPATKGRRLPVVLDEADVVPHEVDAEMGQGFEVVVQDVGRRRLEDDLVL